jgi:hypothetical protein
MSAAKRANELKELSLLGLLTLAARCARRVARLAHLIDDHSDADCGQAIETAVCITEALARGHAVDADEVAAAVDGAMRAVIVASEIVPPCEPAAYAANAAYAAISAVRALMDAVGKADFSGDAERVVEAVRITWESANSADEEVGRAAERDWGLLRDSTVGVFPNLGEPVDTGENGPLGSLFPEGSSSRPLPGLPGKSSPGDPLPTGSSSCHPISVHSESRADADCRKADRRQIEAERALLQQEVERLRTRCNEIEQLRQLELGDLESARAELTRLRVRKQSAAIARYAGSSTDHGSILRIDSIGGPPAAQKNCSDSLPRCPPQTLRLLLDPGTANGRCIAKILSEIIAIGRLSGIALAKLEGREWAACDQSGFGSSSPESPPVATRTAFELLLTVGENGVPAARDARLWEQFQASLQTVMPVLNGPMGNLNLRNGHDVRRHLEGSGACGIEVRTISRDAVILPTRVLASAPAAHDWNEPGTIAAVSASGELMKTQLQKIEGLLQRLANDHGGRLELVGGRRSGNRRCDTSHAYQPRPDAARRCTATARRPTRTANRSAR